MELTVESPLHENKIKFYHNMYYVYYYFYTIINNCDKNEQFQCETVRVESYRSIHSYSHDNGCR